MSFRKFMVKKFKQRDRERKKNKEVWHYICEKGHEWKSYSSPTGSYCADNFGMKETICPECRTPVCMGNVYINGKKTQVGSIHCDFGKKR